MSDSSILTRPIRAAAIAKQGSEKEVESLVRSARVALRFDASAVDNEVGRNIGLASANQILRFGPNLSVIGADDQLLRAMQETGARIHGTSCEVVAVTESDAKAHVGVLNVGTEGRAGKWVTINSDGWSARLAVGTEVDLPKLGTTNNAIGEVAAACLGVAEVFKFVVRLASKPGLSEFSLFSFRQDLPGSLEPGPELPTQPLDIDTFLIGCGAVMNGWAYVVARLPIQGRAEAVDKQSLRSENIGPYVASHRGWMGRPKAELIADVLSPDIKVTPRPDEFEFFKVRLEHGLQVPPMIISGLDNPETRRSVQRLWPATLVDMAAGGFSSQVILKQDVTRGQCILDAFTLSDAEGDYADDLSHEIGIPAEAIRKDPTAVITDEMVDAAPVRLNPVLRRARDRGQRICGRVMAHNLEEERDNPNFAPAVPFATCFSGVVAAAETVKVLLGEVYDLSAHFQFSFESRRGRLLQTSCQSECECQGRRAAA
jgi:hypothetical protein